MKEIVESETSLEIPVEWVSSEGCRRAVLESDILEMLMILVRGTQTPIVLNFVNNLQKQVLSIRGLASEPHGLKVG